jgi:hypothetical protein
LILCVISRSNNRSPEVEWVDDAMALKTLSWRFKNMLRPTSGRGTVRG